MFRQISFLWCAVLILIAIPFSQALAKGAITSKIVLTKNISSTSHQVLFSPYDTIYAVVTLQGLAPGHYSAETNWLNAAGSVNQRSTVSFTIAPNSPFTFYSWLHLMKNGPFKSNLTGKQFDAEYYGKWELQVSIGDIILKKIPFEIR